MGSPIFYSFFFVVEGRAVWEGAKKQMAPKAQKKSVAEGAKKKSVVEGAKKYKVRRQTVRLQKVWRQKMGTNLRGEIFLAPQKKKTIPIFPFFQTSLKLANWIKNKFFPHSTVREILTKIYYFKIRNP